MTSHSSHSSSDSLSAFIFSLTFVSVLWVVGVGVGFFSYGPPRQIQGQSIVKIPLPIIEKNVPNLVIDGKPYLNNLSGVNFSGSGGLPAKSMSVGQSPYSPEQLQAMTENYPPIMGQNGSGGMPSVARASGMPETGPRVIRVGSSQNGTQMVSSFSPQEAYAQPSNLLTIEVPANATSLSIPVPSAQGDAQQPQTAAPFTARLLGEEATPPEKVTANWPKEFGKGQSLPMVASGNGAGGTAASLPQGKGGLSIIIGGLGLDADLTKQAIQNLPPQVTLGFVPYAVHLEKWVKLARSVGHEVVLEIPMEPFDYPRADVGDAVLLTTLSPLENGYRLEWLLGRSSGFAGIMNYQGGKFLSENSAIAPIFQNLSGRGLYMVETRLPNPSIGADLAKSVNLSYKQNVGMIDEDLTPSAVAKTLKTLSENSSTANNQGQHIMAIGYASHGTLIEMEKWLPSLIKKKITLVPASQVVKGQ